MNMLVELFEAKKIVEKIDKYQPKHEVIDKIPLNYMDEYIYQFYNVVLDYFTIKEYNLVHEFIFENDDFIELLREIEPTIRNYFQNEELFLEIIPDPENSTSQLVIYIQIDFDRNPVDNVLDNLHEIDKHVNKLVTKDIKGKFLVTVESL